MIRRQKGLLFGVQVEMGKKQVRAGRGVGSSVCVRATHHVVQFSRLGDSLGFTLSETRLGDL